MKRFLRSKLTLTLVALVMLASAIAIPLSGSILHSHASSAQTSTQTDWPMFGFDAQHTHYNPNETLLNSTNVSGLTLDWSYTTGNFIYNSSPAVVNNIVYIVSIDHKLYALDAITGAFIWSYTINVSGTESISSPAVANGIVYIGSDNSNLYALDAKTGILKWSHAIGSGTDSSPVVANGIVYIGSFDHNLYALDATTGALIWSYTTGDIIESSPAVFNGVVYVGSNDNNLYALDATTGALKWSYTTTSPVNFSPTVANGMVYIDNCCDAKLYALDATTGALIWSYITASNFVLTSSPAVANGIVYFGSGDHNLYALDATTGAFKWSHITASVVYSTPAIANGVIYVGSEDNNLYALDATSGAFLWSYSTGNSILSSPAVANGVVYVGSDDDKLYAFHLPNTTPPSIIVNPTQGQPGTAVTVTGSSWTPGDVVDISLIPSMSILTKATVAGDGTFSTSFTVPVNAATGMQFVNAKDETTGQTAQAPFTVTRGKLFVLVQGINSKLTSDQATMRGGDGQAGFFDTVNNVTGIVPSLQNNGYQNARFLMFSYTGYSSNGKPMSYTCRDTFVNSILSEAKELGKQINAALQGNPNQDVYIIAHSMGGLIAMTYLTALVETQGIVSPLPTGAKLQAIVTLDSPIGGVENTKESLSVAENFYRTAFIGGCGDLLSKDKLTSLKNMANVFPSATNIDAQGETASILAQFLDGANISNQKVMEDARKQGVSILTFSNLIDLLWLPKTACGLTTPDFPSTAWINDEGSNSGIYHRSINSGSYYCYLGLVGNGANHFDVLNNTFVERAIEVFLEGNTPPNY